MSPFGVKRPWGLMKPFWKKGIVAEQDFMLQYLLEVKTMHSITSTNRTLSIPIKIYLHSSLLLWSNEVFFYYWLIRKTNLKMPLPHMICLTCFFVFFQWSQYLMLLFCGDCISSSFSYSNVIILLINSLQVRGQSLCCFTPSLNWDTESHMEIF